MELHCNIITCRKIVYYEQKACVTSCSPCANIKFGQALICPACETSLTQKNDIVLVQLAPSEEYKTSVLAGLKPDIIMDICNRALSFYNYQVSQEFYYREALQVSLENQLETRQNRLQATIQEHTRLLKVEKEKLQALIKENELEKKRNYDLKAEIQSKSRQFIKIQQMYDKLKQKSMGSMIQQSVQGNRSILDGDTDTNIYGNTTHYHDNNSQVGAIFHPDPLQRSYRVPYSNVPSLKTYHPPLHERDDMLDSMRHTTVEQQKQQQQQQQQQQQHQNTATTATTAPMTSYKNNNHHQTLGSYSKPSVITTGVNELVHDNHQQPQAQSSHRRHRTGSIASFVTPSATISRPTRQHYPSHFNDIHPNVSLSTRRRSLV
ncbi:uncharacterized protein BX664DRAFT_382503 [Halteromyces radiatus]|uniref:uncharacterized protein n=1 Tax=Halteromyces radiatus TaxID=101107 RepID=UPI00221FC74A|nr:uncharacterized protein BX664DRAFT_382503 [Halteromyces radiatus]KAI8100062.1 hypothetical protein BX664DRAFT_382503 [Halteromyces radiatus]